MATGKTVSGSGRFCSSGCHYRTGRSDKTLIPYRQIPEIGEGGDRLTYAAHLYKQGRAPKILVTGGRIGLHEAESNAIQTKKLMLEHGLESALLVTSASHMKRATMIFRHQNIKHIPAPTDYRVSGLHYYWRTDLLPEARHLEKTTSVMKEHLGYWYLKLKGY